MATKTGGAGADVLRGTDKADWIYGNGGDDRIDGLAGNDALFGGAGRDTLNGGSGSDYVDGGVGDDTLIYSMAENRNAYDVYNGWTGNDTLRLVLTAAEWARADVKADVARFLAYLPEYNEPLGWIDDPVFSFKSVGLNVVGVNKLEVVVDGKVVNPADAPVVTAADVLALGEDDAGATVDVLANDWAADGVRSVTIAQPAKGKVEIVSTNFTAEKPSALIKFTPGDAYQSLAEGQTATEVFTYTVTDKDGDKKTATVTVTITGTNDGPVAVADTATHIDGSGEILTGSVAGNDKDPDAAAGELYYDFDYWSAPRGFSMETDGSWSYDEGFDSFPGGLKEGESRVLEVAYTVTDAFGATSQAVLTLTIQGVNDVPFVHTVDLDVEEDADYPPDENGMLDRFLSLELYDRDSEDMTVTILNGPADPLGSLEYAGYYDGAVGFYYRVDAALVAALDEGETLVQTYRVQIDDGDGGVVEMDVPVTIIGDGEDPTVFLDVESPEFAESGAGRAVEFDFDFEDKDEEEEIRFEVRPVGETLGTWTIIPDGGFDGKRYIRVVFEYSYTELDTLPTDLVELKYQIVAIDSAGKELVVEHSVRPRDDVYTQGTDGNDDINAYTNRGDDHTYGGAGDDRLLGGDGRDFLYGDEGPALPAHESFDEEAYFFEWSEPVAGLNDELDGGASADTLHGGAGADRFLFRPGQADGDVVLDFDPAAGDRLEFHDYGEGATFTRLEGNRWEIASADRSVVDVITLANGAAPTPESAVFVNRPTFWKVGTEGDERLYGEWDSPNVLVGNGGSDSLSGGGFADQLYGDAGPALPDGVENSADARFWWPGQFDDELDGGGGADLLVGGEGADLFTFYAGEADGDVVRDFNAADGDRLDFSGYDWQGVTFTQLDATRWEIADAERTVVEVITFTNGATITPDDYFLG